LLPVLASGHHLFDADPGHTSLHTRRWTARPRPWPRCQSPEGAPWGPSPDRPGGKRSWGHGCQRPCNDLPPTRLPQSQRSCAYGMLATCLGGLACSSRRIARARRGQSRTS
jgi:hypothetical protein